MKIKIKLMIIFLPLLVIACSYCSDSRTADSGEKVHYLDKGTVTPYQGVLLPAGEYEKMYDAYKLAELNRNLNETLAVQISRNKELLLLKEEEVRVWREKFLLEEKYRLELQARLLSSEAKVQALTIATSAGFGIALGELFGLGIFLLFNNN